MGGTSAVIDFGQPLTTSSVEAVSGNTNTNVKAIYRWLGDKFDTANPVFTPTSPATSAATANFAEVASARLQVELVGTTAQVSQAMAEAMKVKLPALPADLELRINGGPVVWSYPGPRGEPGTDGWVTAGPFTQKEVDLTEFVAPLVGVAGSTTNTTLTIELKARIPGKLGVVLSVADYDLVDKVPVLPDPNIVFPTEGAQLYTLSVPGGNNTALKELWVTVTGSPPKERAVPSVGPPAIQEVELVLDSNRSACVRFPDNLLADLTALRLPAARPGRQRGGARPAPGAGGRQPPGQDEPGPPLEGQSATQPVQLEPPPTVAGRPVPPPNTPDAWTLLPFDKPVSLKTPVWVSLQVIRGTVRWSLASGGAGDGLPYQVRRGSPTGPWLPLPGAVTALPGVGGRLHAIGHRPKESPLAPLQLQIIGSGYEGPLTDVTPTAKGVTVKLTVAAPNVSPQNAAIYFINRTPEMSVTVTSMIRVIAKP